MITEIINCLEHSLNFIQQQVADLSDGEMVLQPTGAPNNAVWTLGHLTYCLQEIVTELGADPWLAADWERQFAYGSLADAIRPEFSNKNVLLTALVDAGEHLRTVLLTLDNSTLTRPLADAETRKMMPTMGHMLLQVIVAHTAYHAGQLAAWRRAIGLKPIGVFI